MENHFFYCDEDVKAMYNEYGLYFSEKFCQYFADQFELIFKRDTGIGPSYKVSIGGFKQHNDVPMYQVGIVSKINLVLWILPDFMDVISFCWKSKSGKIVKTTDEDFDVGDLECWIEGLKPSLYWKEVATEKKSYPFHVNNLPYTLKVFGFGMNMVLTISLSDTNRINTIGGELVDTVEKHNKMADEMAENLVWFMTAIPPKKEIQLFFV